MRILIHSDEYYPTCQACAYRMKVFAETFSDLGDDVTVIASSANKDNGIVGESKERIIYSPTVKMKKKTTLMRMVSNLSFAVTSVFSSFKAGGIDVVITTSPPPLISLSGWLIARLKRAKLVYDVRDIWPDVALEMNSFSEGSVFCKVFRWITSFMYKHADMVTTVSPGKVEKICGKLPEDRRNKVYLIGNGFDESVLNGEIDESVVQKYELDKKFSCVYIGNIGLAQGLDSLLDLAAKTTHRDVQFLVFGMGAEREMLEQRAKREGLNNVRFCGVLPHEKVFTVLKYAKLSYIPLKNANMKDSVPTKIYEALGLGCPVLLVAEGDSCNIVHESEFGRCISPDNIELLPTTFDNNVENYEKLMKHQTYAMQLMKSKYSRQKIAVGFESLLKKQK